MKKLLCLGLDIPSFFNKDQCLHYPVIATSAIDIEDEPFIESLHKSTHLLFTSKSGVFYFSKKLEEAGVSKAHLGNKQYLAVGPSTAKAIKELLNEDAIFPDKEYSQEGVITLLEKLTSTDFLLYPKAKLSRDLIEKYCVEKSLAAEVVPIYETKVLRHSTKVCFDEIKGIYFSSPSTVEGYKVNFEDIPDHVSLYFSGKVTASYFKKWYLRKFDSLEKVYPLSSNEKIYIEP